jgi:hypothetical protein
MVSSESERQTGRLQALAESAQLFAEASTDLARLLGVVARRFSELVGEATNVRLIEGDALVPVATYHPDPEVNEYLRVFHDETPLKVGEGISGQVLATGEPYYMPELDLEQLKKRIAPRFVSIFEKVGIAGMIVVRLRSRGINSGTCRSFAPARHRARRSTATTCIWSRTSRTALPSPSTTAGCSTASSGVSPSAPRSSSPRTASSRRSHTPCRTIFAPPSAPSTGSRGSSRRTTAPSSTTKGGRCWR